MAKSDRSLILPVLLVCGVIAVGVAAYVKLAPADVVPREVVEKEQQTGGERVQVLTPYYANDELRFRAEPMDVPPNVDPKVFALNTYLRTVTFVPEDAVVKTVAVSNGVATADFNSAFYTSYGTADEATVVNGILAVLGQFPDVSSVLFKVDGEPIDSLGNLELTDPLPVIRLPQLEAGGSSQTPSTS